MIQLPTTVEQWRSWSWRCAFLMYGIALLAIWSWSLQVLLTAAIPGALSIVFGLQADELNSDKNKKDDGSPGPL